MLSASSLMVIASALFVAGGILLALACAKAEPTREVKRYPPFFSSDEWVHVEPVVKQAFEGHW